jgi:hypothetical protein
MGTTLVRYKTKVDAADENERKIIDVFSELKRLQPKGLRYLVLRLPNEESFHLAVTEDGAIGLTELEAFETFRRGGDQRWLELPMPVIPKFVGSYGFSLPSDFSDSTREDAHLSIGGTLL